MRQKIDLPGYHERNKYESSYLLKLKGLLTERRIPLFRIGVDFGCHGSLVTHVLQGKRYNKHLVEFIERTMGIN